jgi:glycosyltransferase involved in cell wall biosynthesis
MVGAREHTVRILMFFPSLGRGGTEEHALVVSIAGAQLGHELLTCFPETPQTRSVVADVAAAGLAFVPWPLGQPGVDGRNDYGTVDAQFAEMTRVLDRIRPDAVVMMVPWPDSTIGAILACAAAEVPTVPVFCLVRDVGDIPAPLRHRCALARAGTQRWVAVSADNRGVLNKLFAIDEPDEIAVVYNGVDLPERWRAPSAGQVDLARAELRRELRLPPRARIALTVARLAPVKGHSDVLAAARLTEPDTDLHYVWVGDGPLHGRLRDTAERLGLADRVHLLGYRQDIPALLHAADLFVFPTHGEGCSRALIEAMTAGLPVIAADASSNPELVTDGRHGLLYPTGDPERLAERLRAACLDIPRMRQLGAAARERARQTFTAGAMCAGTYRVLDDVVADRRRPRPSLDAAATGPR